MSELVFKSRAMQTLEQRLDKPLDEYLAEQYALGLSQEQIAQELGVNRATVSRWMGTYGIAARYFGPRRKAA